MKRVLLATAALVVAVVVCVALALPASRVQLARPRDDGTVAGVIHIHTNRSDGLSGPDEIAAAAARAGLAFIIFTDHGDATRKPDAPVYRDGVLCIDGVEISTAGGHYVALDLPQAPYPLGGEPRDVVEDVARLGGFGIAAHPDSPKPELRWQEWTAPFDGMEIINPDTSWRRRAAATGVRSKLRLLEALVTYPVRPAETIAGFLTDSSDNLTRWEALTRRRKVVGLAGADAHSKLALKSVEPGDNRYSLPLPSYEASFRTLSVHVRPDAPLVKNAAADARDILRAIRSGHLYTAVDGLASPPYFELTAEDGRGRVAREGDDMTAGRAGDPMTLHIRSNAPAAFTTIVWQGSRILRTSREADFMVPASAEPAVYRVEIHASDRESQPTWLFSNPIYVRSEAPTAPPHEPSRGTDTIVIFDGHSRDEWHTEHGVSSEADMDLAGTGRPGEPVQAFSALQPRRPDQAAGVLELRLRYRLSSRASETPYAALLCALAHPVGSNDRIAFTARADRPMRVSVQLRTDVSDAPADRWQRSVYIDTVAREHIVFFDDMTPIGNTRNRRPPLETVRDVIFVVDTTNARPGASGQVWIDRAALQR